MFAKICAQPWQYEILGGSSIIRLLLRGPWYLEDHMWIRAMTRPSEKYTHTRVCVTSQGFGSPWSLFMGSAPLGRSLQVWPHRIWKWWSQNHIGTFGQAGQFYVKTKGWGTESKWAGRGIFNEHNIILFFFSDEDIPITTNIVKASILHISNVYHWGYSELSSGINFCPMIL